jgi:hypothetical protein
VIAKIPESMWEDGRGLREPQSVRAPGGKRRSRRFRPRASPFDTVRGRKITTPISISTLTAVKNSDWTTVAEVTPATEDPRTLLRKMPIITAVPACAGVTALIAVPPCEAP